MFNNFFCLLVAGWLLTNAITLLVQLEFALLHEQSSQSCELCKFAFAMRQLVPRIHPLPLCDC